MKGEWMKKKKETVKAETLSHEKIVTWIKWLENQCNIDLMHAWESGERTKSSMSSNIHEEQKEEKKFVKPRQCQKSMTRRFK